MIHSENLVHEYSRRDEEGNVTGILRAVDGVSIDVKDGDFIAILGANGSGKSTFAKHLNRLLVPTEGTLYIDGKDASDAGNTLAIRQTAGMVFQNPDNQIISNIVEEDVGFGPENMGVPTQEILKRVEECLKEVGMYSYRRRSPNHLSGGQKQRVAIAGIMAMRPKCIILDEATAMLDPVGRKKVLDTVHKLNRDEKITIIMITHYMEEAETLCDRVGFMCNGTLGETDAPANMIGALGRYTVDEAAEGGITNHYFQGKEDAIHYLSASSTEASLRSTTLEDVFLEKIGQQLERRS
mgnify:CR=1 FL=1